MLQTIGVERYSEINRVLASDSARSYFIRLGLLSDETYTSVHGEFSEDGQLLALLCRRRSGTMQFWSAEGFNGGAFRSVLAALPWESLIGPRSCCQPFVDAGLFETVNKGAWIAGLAVTAPDAVDSDILPLGVQDLMEVSALYDTVFDHHMSVNQMQSKLETGRGRGVLIRREGCIVCVAQTEFEEPHSALIVGVATHPDHQRQGLAAACTGHLCRVLSAEGKNPYLQYDNPDAGKLYEKLGFRAFDRVLHCRR